MAFKEHFEDDESPVSSSIVEFQDPEKRPACFKSTIQECLFILTATMSIGTSSFLYGICSVITASIGRGLNMTSAEITWISASSALTSGSLLLFFAKVADTFGRRSLLIFSTGAFAAFSLVTGFATNAIYLDTLLGVLGLWSAGAVPPAVGILGAAYERPSKRKNRAFACFSAGNPLGAILGTIFSGIAAHLFNWRASYYLLAIIYVVFFAVAIVTVPKTQRNTEPLSWETLKKFDLVGIFLSMAGIALFCSSLSIAGDAPHGWRTPYVLAMLVLGVVFIVSFVAWEGYCKYPMMPLRIWKDRNFSLINLIVMFGFMSFGTSSFWVSLFMQNVLRFSPLEVAVHLLPQAVVGILVNIIAGLVLHKVSNKLLMGIGSVAYFGASLLLALMRGDHVYWPFIAPSLALAVIGADLQFNVANMYVMSSLPPEKQSLGGGIFNTVTKICGAVGLAISSSVYNAESTSSAALQTSSRPYNMAFWFCAASAGLGICFVPFLTIGTQGHSTKESAAKGSVGVTSSATSDGQVEKINVPTEGKT
ncbi:hypothetical protein OIDMADRAFT_44850 [Oidiodendron maius Zn]|uniref:Major facilitator superfamily (MFS) profile domain-containing protein n=1 Tax=Oidiodendron maius (strain Zn) TaxID=913774 RepID=A0A0C3CB23_OIDMZ|nr:hypothetical protein OIDMADRAFT_44850 [Oidiodendron maius Zn]